MMLRMLAISPLTLAAAGIVLIAGCTKSDRPQLGIVTGTVKLDGEPLPEAMISFSPVEGGRTSTAVTDSEGKYELNYTTDAKGARIGEHHVRVSTFQQGGDEPDSPQGVPEKVPAKYQKAGSLQEEVGAGENTIDLELTSK